MRKHFLAFLVVALLPLASWADGLSVYIDGKAYDDSKDYSIVYEGTSTQFVFSVKEGDQDLTENSGYLVQWYKANEDGTKGESVKSIDNVGKYILWIQGTTLGTYNQPAKEVPFSVTPKPLTIALKSNGVTKSYGDKNTTINLESIIDEDSSEKPVDNKSLSEILKDMNWAVYEVGKSTELEDGKEPAGTDLNVVLSNREGANYEVTLTGGSSDKTLLLTVNPLNVTLTLDGAIYSGEAISLDSQVKLSSPKQLPNDESLSDLELSYEVTKESTKVENDKVINAGTYSVVITGANSNYIINSDPVEFVIKKATLTISKSDDKVSKVYGDEDPVLTNVFKFMNGTTEVSADVLTSLGLTIVRHGGESVIPSQSEGNESYNAEGYYIYPALVDKDGAYVKDANEDVIGTDNVNKKLDNYTIEDYTLADYMFYITAKTITITPQTLESVVYGTAKSTINTSVNGTSKVAGLSYVIKVGASGTEQTVAKADLNTVVLAGEEKLATLPAIAIDWNDAGNTPSAGTYTLGFGTSSDDEDLTESVTLSEGASKDNYEFIFGTEDFIIEKAEMTITALDKNITYGNTIDETSLGITTNTIAYNTTTHEGADNIKLESTYLTSTAVKLIPNVLKNALIIDYDVADVNKVDTYPNAITFAVSEDELNNAEYTNALANYTFKLKSGALIVDPKSTLAFDGSATGTEVTDLLEAYDGAVVKTVTIKKLNQFLTNLAGDEHYTEDDTQRILKAGRWYTLVLPFEVEVYEISNAFGYAIVNVPDESNTVNGQFKYKLEMTTVPANTLMAFKVAYDKTFEGNATMKFTNKTIVNPGAEAVKEIAGNNFIGVYKLAELNSSNDFYLNPQSGDFRSTSSIAGYLGTDVKIYPFNGYFSTSSTNARILMQEADGTVTSIDSVTGEEIYGAEGWYTINGVKLNAEPTQKGIYINNGKKVIIK